MKRSGFILVVCLALLTLWGCRTQKTATSTTKQQDNSPTLITFDNGTTVSKAEFERVYAKTSGGREKAATHSMEEYKEYLDLYINFKRKVMEAESLGIDETDAFKQEFEGYRKQLAEPYLVEQKVQESLIREAYERGKWYVKASHILIMCPPDALPDDTLIALNKAKALRDSILKGGKDFNSIAQKYSQDPSARDNKGNLGFFTVFDLVYPFETAAYKASVNQVTKPIRTGYGYHLIKVHEKIQSPGNKRAAHIIVRIGPSYSAKDTAQAIEKINEIYNKLKGGEDFAELAKKYSDDGLSAPGGGDLGYTRLLPEMQEAKIRLKEGEYSKPFMTSYGWHILSVTEVQPNKSFDEAKPGIKSKISKDARSYLSREVLINRVKKENNFTLYEANIQRFIEMIHEPGKFNKGFWRPVDSLHSQYYGLKIYSMGEGDDAQSGTIEDMISFYKGYRKGIDGSGVEEAARNFVNIYTEAEVLKFEEKQLPEKYPEYKHLVQEYHDGILLFTLTEDKIWKKAVEDTVGLKEYYNNNKDDFKAGERVTVKEYEGEKKENLTKVEIMLAKGKTDEEIDKDINENSSLNLRIRTLTYEKGKNPAEGADLFGKKKGYNTGIVEVESGFRIYVVQEVKPAGVKSFDESKSECITKYQNYLEDKWENELSEKYPVKVNDDQMTKLFK